jgi:hypothetical protein
MGRSLTQMKTSVARRFRVGRYFDVDGSGVSGGTLILRSMPLRMSLMG